MSMSEGSDHALWYEGAPFDDQGNRSYAWAWSVSGVGRAKCHCGMLSPVLPSARQRKAWHRAHKIMAHIYARAVADIAKGEAVADIAEGEGPVRSHD
jgi:hypothetical protein